MDDEIIRDVGDAIRDAAGRGLIGFGRLEGEYKIKPDYSQEFDKHTTRADTGKPAGKVTFLSAGIEAYLDELLRKANSDAGRE